MLKDELKNASKIGKETVKDSVGSSGVTAVEAVEMRSSLETRVRSSMRCPIAVVDDESNIRDAICGILEDEGYQALQAGGAKELQLLFDVQEDQCPGLVILDVMLRGSPVDGMALLRWLREEHAWTQVIMISGHGTIDLAVKATKMGASTFLTKPFSAQVLLFSVKKALEEERLRRENEHLKWLNGQQRLMFPGRSTLARQVREQMTRVAPTDSRVLLHGEPGSGKSVAAASIHRASSYAQGLFVQISCAGKSPDALQKQFLALHTSEGAQPPASLEPGTIVFEDIDLMPSSTQEALLKLLNEVYLTRVGAPNGRAPNRRLMRVMASSRSTPEQLLQSGQFLKELYERLAVSVISLPSLAKRLEDIPMLIELSMLRASALTMRPPRSFEPAAIAVLKKHTWPDNLREFDMVISKTMTSAYWRAHAVSVEEILQIVGQESFNPKEVEERLTLEAILNQPLKTAKDYFEQLYLDHHIRLSGGNISLAAKNIGMNRAALHRKIQLARLARSSQEPDPHAPDPHAPDLHAQFLNDNDPDTRFPS